MSNNIAYACAVEKLMGWELPERGQAIRVLCCELSRISSCFLGTGVYAMDTGAMTAFLYAFEEKERVHNLYEQICGARFTSSYTRIGGMTRDLPKGIKKQVLDFCDSALRTVDEMEKLLLHNKIFIDRLVGVGVITKQMALDCGMTGNNLRASGVKRDLRKTNPYLGYDKYEFDVPVAEEGDCYARFQVRMEEIRQSVRIIRQVMETLPGGPICVQTDKGILPDKKEAMQNMEAAEMMASYLEKRQQIQAMMEEENPDPGAMKRLSDEMDEIQEKLQMIDDITNLTIARAEFNQVIGQINQVLQFVVTGRMEEEGCGGDCGGCTSCDSCSGCH
jgi:NADH-quinone oxidoreductase subunit D